MSGNELSEAVSRAFTLMAAHPAVLGIGKPVVDTTHGTVSVEVTFEVSMPGSWRAAGGSPSAVRTSEVVRYDFPSGYPLDAPDLSLRPDFSRKLPHMQPYLIDARPVPCIYDGSITELLHRDGLQGILNQTSSWLDRAANNGLIDPEQGWEPVRRDVYEEYLVADAEALRGLVDRRGGHKYLRLEYLRFVVDGGRCAIHAEVSDLSPKINAATIPNLFGEHAIEYSSGLWRGKSLALVVWPGRHPSGDLIVCDEYLPETVANVDDLKARAALYGCQSELETGLSWLGRTISGYSSDGPCPLAIILLARRPCQVIGSSSPIELCPYLVDIRAPELFVGGGASPVRPAAHRNAISRSLLSQMAGNPSEDLPYWTLIGAGSLGSKLALHLARAGRGPETIIDCASMTPHNAARHALIPHTGDMQLFWIDKKAGLLSGALRGLDQEATPIVENVIDLLRDAGRNKAWSKRSWAIVNATASLSVREALGSAEHLPTRVIETSLFAGGSVGLITLEGRDRNPNTSDLISEFYAHMREDPGLASILFGSHGTSRQSVGVGCGTLTMPMSDGRLSMFAASMSEYLLAKQLSSLPTNRGEIVIGKVTEDGLGIGWQSHHVPAVTSVQAVNGEAWHVHIHARARDKIQQEVENWPRAETGGIIMGRLSEASHTFHVVDVLDAPKDSSRSAGEFVLGTQGMRQALRAYSESVGWSLYCLGTWHSHLSASGPSPTDRATAAAVSLARLSPSVLLIHTPAGFQALLAIGERKPGESASD